jgi:hypothetical protein
MLFSIHIGLLPFSSGLIVLYIISRLIKKFISGCGIVKNNDEAKTES